MFAFCFNATAMAGFAVSESHVILIKIYCVRKRKKSVAICMCSPISYFNVFEKLLFHSMMMMMIARVCIICCSLVQFKLKLVHNTSNEVKLQSTRRNENSICPTQSNFMRNIFATRFVGINDSILGCVFVPLSSLIVFCFSNPLIYANSMKPLLSLCSTV